MPSPDGNLCDPGSSIHPSASKQTTILTEAEHFRPPLKQNEHFPLHRMMVRSDIRPGLQSNQKTLYQICMIGMKKKMGSAAWTCRGLVDLFDRWRVSVPKGEIVKVDHIEIAIEPWSWDFAIARRNEIDQYFARLQLERSALWNGRVFLLNRYSIRNGVMRGAPRHA